VDKYIITAAAAAAGQADFSTFFTFL